MAIRKPVKLLPTMKIDADPKEKLDLKFEECQAKITDINDVETKKFGTKTKIDLKNEDTDKEFSVFANNYTIENLSRAFGEEDNVWKGKLVNLKMEKDKQFNNDMIVLHPVK